MKSCFEDVRIPEIKPCITHLWADIENAPVIFTSLLLQRRHLWDFGLNARCIEFYPTYERRQWRTLYHWLRLGKVDWWLRSGYRFQRRHHDIWIQARISTLGCFHHFSSDLKHNSVFTLISREIQIGTNSKNIEHFHQPWQKVNLCKFKPFQLKSRCSFKAQFDLNSRKCMQNLNWTHFLSNFECRIHISYEIQAIRANHCWITSKLMLNPKRFMQKIDGNPQYISVAHLGIKRATRKKKT